MCRPVCTGLIFQDVLRMPRKLTFKSFCFVLILINLFSIYFSRGTLHKHTFEVHNEGTGFSCHMCGASFFNKSLLKSHISTKHATGRMYQCDKCPKSFRYRTGLRTHQLSHTGKYLGMQHKFPGSPLSLVR